MLRTLFRSSHKTLSVLRTRAIHTNGAGEVPKTEANTGSHTTRTPQTTHRTGPKGDGDMPHPQEYVDGIEPVEGNSGSEAGASPEKQPTRSTGIKSGTYERPLLLSSALCLLPLQLVPFSRIVMGSICWDRRENGCWHPFLLLTNA